MGFIQITFIDILDILAIATFMFLIYKITKGSQASYILTGIVLLLLLWVLVGALGMEMLSAVLSHIIDVGVIALIVVFQPEIRRFLQLIGKKSRERRGGFLGRILDFNVERKDDSTFLNPVVKACADMAADKTGALIVIQQEMDLSMIAETGIAVDSIVTSSLLKNIFFKNSPLHDGAVIINNGRIEAAKCILPTTQNPVPVSFGLRHRAALGISEYTDSIVIVVSEETGTISVANNGQINCGIPASDLANELLALLHRKQKPEPVEAPA